LRGGTTFLPRLLVDLLLCLGKHSLFLALVDVLLLLAKLCCPRVLLGQLRDLGRGGLVIVLLQVRKLARVHRPKVVLVAEELFLPCST